MEVFKETLKKDEQVSSKLRSVYEQFGYKKYKMGGFEEYSLYLENRDFLPSDQIIAFPNAQGKMMALKPDVTLSIIKNTKARRGQTDKLYYMENVFRHSKDSHEYQEISQMGLELIGDVGTYETWEILELALESLAAIESEFILDISHMGFVTGLLDNMSIDRSVREELLACIRSRNLHDLRAICKREEISRENCEKLEAMVMTDGDAYQMLKKAEELVENESMSSALEELKKLMEIASIHPFSNHIHIDFSIVNQIDYYNGIVFQGFTKHLPQNVLFGGRYDHLLEKFEKDAGGIGFALYLNDLNRVYPVKQEYDVDILLLYDEAADFKTLSKTVCEMVNSGYRVRTERSIPEDCRFQKLVNYREESEAEHA